MKDIELCGSCETNVVRQACAWVDREIEALVTSLANESREWRPADVDALPLVRVCDVGCTRDDQASRINRIARIEWREAVSNAQNADETSRE